MYALSISTKTLEYMTCFDESGLSYLIIINHTFNLNSDLLQYWQLNFSTCPFALLIRTPYNKLAGEITVKKFVSTYTQNIQGMLDISFSKWNRAKSMYVS
jgi:hypothetical protein